MTDIEEIKKSIAHIERALLGDFDKPEKGLLTRVAALEQTIAAQKEKTIWFNRLLITSLVGVSIANILDILLKLLGAA